MFINKFKFIKFRYNKSNKKKIYRTDLYNYTTYYNKSNFKKSYINYYYRYYN